MTKKIALAIIHGIGRQTDDFALEMEEEIKKRFAKKVKEINPSIQDPNIYLVCKPVCWADIFEEPEAKLWQKFQTRDLDFICLRETMVHVFADAIAYQKSPNQRNFYQKIHEKIDEKLQELAFDAGAAAPLCVIAHSLGSVIMSNHFYDLQQGKRRDEQLDIPLIKGETLTLFFTLGSPISLWSISYDEFDKPIRVPANKMKEKFPTIGKWINFYDRDDIIGYPLEPLYGPEFVHDIQVNAGGILTGWNPLSHSAYWTANSVTKRIADELVKVWMEINK